MNQNYSAHNYYEVLEVSALAPQHEVHRAYLRAKETYSPDSPALYTMFTKEEANELLKLIEEAFVILSDPLKRQKYDEYLTQKELQTGSSLPDFSAPMEMGPDHSGPPLLEMLASDTLEENRIDMKEIEADVKSMRNGAYNPVKDNSAKETHKKPEIPAGFSKTRVSIYEEKPHLEQEIKSTTEFTGEFIKKVRQYKNIELATLSNETRISKTYLAAIEAEDYDALPAHVFVRGFVVQVAKVIGLDSEKVANSYMARLKKDS